MKQIKVVILLALMTLSMNVSAQLLGTKVNEYGFEEIKKNTRTSMSYSSAAALKGDDNKTFRLEADLCIPTNDQVLEALLSKEIFGIEDTFEGAFRQYCKGVTKGKKELAKNTIRVIVRAEYTCGATGLLTLAYTPLSPDHKITTVKYLTYDLNNNKVVALSDLLSDAVIASLVSKGIDATVERNIKADEGKFEVFTSKFNLTLDVEKLKANMTEYGLSLLPPVQTGEVLQKADVNPEFPGGQRALMSYLNENLHYPANCQRNKIDGRVIVTFVVNADGSISEVKTLKSVEPELDHEAIRVISAMPRWTPGKVNGEPVRVRFSLPVSFRLR